MAVRQWAAPSAAPGRRRLCHPDLSQSPGVARSADASERSCCQAPPRGLKKRCYLPPPTASKPAAAGQLSSVGESSAGGIFCRQEALRSRPLPMAKLPTSLPCGSSDIDNFYRPQRHARSPCQNPENRNVPKGERRLCKPGFGAMQEARSGALQSFLNQNIRIKVTYKSNGTSLDSISASLYNSILCMYAWGPVS